MRPATGDVVLFSLVFLLASGVAAWSLLRGRENLPTRLSRNDVRALVRETVRQECLR